MTATGRPPSTTHEEIGAIALELFRSRGFEETSVEDIAAAVGVGRRTIFRYFPSKNDMVWGDFDWVIGRLREHLEEAGEEVPLAEALRRAAILSNRYPAEQLPGLRIRLTLITTVPALQAHSMLRYAAWRRVIAEWAGRRLGQAPEELLPSAISHLALGASMAAFTRWVEDPGADLERCLDEAYRLVAVGIPEAAGERRR
jgi:TetR/AcrR family transcriptional regulator, regulator of mycofactocin system